MTAIHETAYPRIRSNVTDEELLELYTPSEEELDFASEALSLKAVNGFL